MRCDYCSDFRHIEPSGMISSNDDETNKILRSYADKKLYLKAIYKSGHLDDLVPVSSCPACGHVFTQEDYDKDMKYYPR